MIDTHDHQSRTTDEGQAFPDGARKLQQVLNHPFAAGFLAVAGAALLFWLSYFIGETVYSALDGDDGAAARFGLTFAAVLVALAVIAARLGRHRTARDDERALTTIREFHQVLDHPCTAGLLALAGVLILFWLGIGVGETLYDAFDGNAGGAAVFGIILVTAIGAIVALGVWLDHRRDAGDDEQGSL